MQYKKSDIILFKQTKHIINIGCMQIDRISKEACINRFMWIVTCFYGRLILIINFIERSEL